MPEKKSPVETALRMISQRRLSSKELSKKMKTKGYSDEEINETIDYLKSSHYLNDTDLLLDYVNYLIEKKMYGPERVIAYLQKKGFEKDSIRKAILSFFDDEQFIQNATRLLAKKIKDIDLEELKIKNKAIRILTYNGYNWDIIERVINK